MPTPRDLLEGATNHLGGPLDRDSRERIFRYLDDPTAENWSDVHSLVINDEGKMAGKPPRTVWHAVSMADPSYRYITVGRPGGVGVPHEERWSKWPDALLVARAIRAALASVQKPPEPPRRHRR